MLRSHPAFTHSFLHFFLDFLLSYAPGHRKGRSPCRCIHSPSWPLAPWRVCQGITSQQRIGTWTWFRLSRRGPWHERLLSLYAWRLRGANAVVRCRIWTTWNHRKAWSHLLPFWNRQHCRGVSPASTPRPQGGLLSRGRPRNPQLSPCPSGNSTLLFFYL